MIIRASQVFFKKELDDGCKIIVLRYVWKVFMEQEDYSRALAVARDRKEIDSAAYELVLSRQADKYISEKKSVFCFKEIRLCNVEKIYRKCSISHC